MEWQVLLKYNKKLKALHYKNLIQILLQLIKFELFYVIYSFILKFWRNLEFIFIQIFKDYFV